MNHLPIWYIGKIASEICDKAGDEFKLIAPNEATMGIDASLKDLSTRNTSIRFAEKAHWFGKILHEFGLEANDKCDWQYELNNHESVQFAEYGPNQHYNWHVDNFPLSGSVTERKVTVVCLMNDPSEFTGGQLQIRLYNDYDAPLSKGSIIAFPSILEHRVLPVMSGIRYSAVMWLTGPRFR